MSKIRRKIVTFGLVFTALLMVLAGCSSGSTDKTDGQKSDGNKSDKPEFVFKFGHDQAPEHAYNEAAKYFAQKINEKTNGRVQIDVFPSAQLGEEVALMDGLRTGAIDFSISSTSNASSHVPEFGLMSVSYLFNDADHLYKVATDEQIVKRYVDMVEQKNPGFKLVTFLPNGQRNLYATKAIKSIDDVKGLKMRVMASPVEAKVWEAIGAKPTAIPFSDVYTSLQTNLIEAAENTASSFETSKHYEVTPYYMNTGHEWLMSEVWISSKTWEKIPQDIKDIIMETGAEMAKYGLDKQLELDQKSLDKMVKENNLTVIDLDVAPFREKVAPLQDSIAKDLKTEDVLSRIRELGK